MAKHDPDMQGIEDALRKMRMRLGGMGSMQSSVEQRMAGTSIRPPRRILPGILVGAAILFVLLLVINRNDWLSPRPAQQHVGPIDRAWPEASTLVLGDAELTAYAAAMVEGRAVVVIWSIQGGGSIPADDPQVSEVAYRRRTLRTWTTSDGRAHALTLFIPAANVHPMLDPPSIRARLRDSSIVCFTTSPSPATQSEVAAIVQASGGADAGRGGVDSLLAEIHNQIQS